MDSALKLFFSPWFWADIILSVTGGVIVFWGLMIEKKAEKYSPPADFKPDIFGDIADAQKKELERGWRILMLGIAFEVVAALGISVISSLEIADLTNKASAANLEAEQAGKDATAAKLQVGIITETNLLLAAKLEELHSNNIMLEAKISPRTIDFEKSQRLARDLFAVPKSSSWDETVWIIADSRAIDAQRYAREICRVVSSGGFHVQLSSTNTPMSEDDEFPSGVAFVDKRRPVEKEYESEVDSYRKTQDNEILQAFRNAGIEMLHGRQLFFTDYRETYSGLYILVGPKERNSAF